MTLLAKPHAAPLLARFAPAVEHVSLTAPWTAFHGKYQLHRWPWHELTRAMRELRGRRFDLGVSARRDPRDHALLALAGAQRRLGFPHRGSGMFLTESLSSPGLLHRSEHWRALASRLHVSWPQPTLAPRNGRRILIHTGAGQPVRKWPTERFTELAGRLRTAGWAVVLMDDTFKGVNELIDSLANADRFMGNDSGPGHLAALLGVPTFTIFGPQLPELFAPQHPQAAWIEGTPCPYKPCFDACRFPSPFCIRDLTVDDVWRRLRPWLDNGTATA